MEFVFYLKADFIYIYIFKIFIYLFLETGEVREREGEKHCYVRETVICCLSEALNQGPGLQPRHVP